MDSQNIDNGHLSSDENFDAMFTPDMLPDQGSSEDVEPSPSWWSSHKRQLTFGSVAVAAAGGLLGAGLFIGSHSSRSAAESVPGPDKRGPVATEAVATPSKPATPSETAATPAPSETMNENNQLIVPEISAEQTPEQIGNQIVQEALVDWRNAGVTKTIVADQQRSGLASADYAADVAAKWGTAYENALFVDGWEKDPDILAYSQQIRAQHIQTLNLTIDTAQDEYPFSWYTDDIRVINVSGGTYSAQMTILIHDTNNATQNTAMEIDPSVVDNTLNQKRIGVKLVRVGDVMKISAIQKMDVE